MEAKRCQFHNVTEYLAWDHDAQEDLLLETRDAADRGDLASASSRYDAYERGLQRHMRLEERILFPLIEAVVPSVAGVVLDMRQEHGVVRRRLEAMRKALIAGDLDDFRRSYEALGWVLLAHEAREEKLLYPVLDRSLSPEQRADLAARLAHEV